MALEDFEKSLAEDRQKVDGDEESRRTHHHHRHHGKRKHHRNDEEKERRHKRSRNSDRDRSEEANSVDPRGDQKALREDIENKIYEQLPKPKSHTSGPSRGETRPKRDSWMEAPSALDIDYTQRGAHAPPKPSTSRSSKADFELKIHENELNKHYLENLAEGQEVLEELTEDPSQNRVDYVFGDSGSRWRMSKLKNVFRRAEETGQSVDQVATNVYGDLRSFDDAREEQVEVERRETYGPGYIGKEKPSGELFQERKMHMGVRTNGSNHADEAEPTQEVTVETQPPFSTTVRLDHTALNRLKAQMMKAKFRGSADASRLECEYEAALNSSVTTADPGTVVLGAMDNRMLAGNRKGEVKAIDNKRGRERGLVEENEDMSIDDMVREERRTRYQAGGENQRFAERIAKDGKFDNGLDYMEENASKLAKRVHKSEINLKNGAISDFQKMNRILDSCQLCHREESYNPPVAPVVSLATRTYLTIPTEPEISEGGACIVPLQHRTNLLECDDDEWEEIRNFMKSLTRMYHDQGRDVIFYENAAAPQRKKHAAMEVVPLPYRLGETAPAFFKEAILSADEEWTQHTKLIDTLAKAKQGLGKSAFRKTLVKEMPYFHVWFQIDGGLGHIVEDSNRWPKGDLFAREIIGGMLDEGPEIIKKQGRWSRSGDARLEGFRQRWRKFDWTRVLTDT